MPRTASKVVPWLWILTTCWGCAGRQDEPDSALEATEMSIQEARQVVAELGDQTGFGKGTGPAPASIAEVREIVRTDQLGRFDSARVYAARLSGVDALALRASLEALWADALLTVADLFHETRLRRESDLRTLRATRETLDEDEADRLIAERKQQIEEASRHVAALRTLAQPHLEAARELSAEAQRQAPQAVAGYLPGAHAALLERAWVDFDRAIRKAEALSPEPTDYGRYSRALERAMRFAQREEARQQLEELLAGSPELSRARARLVLLEETPLARHEHLEQLKQHSPGHPIVVLAGPTIEREFVISSELRADDDHGEALQSPPVPAEVPAEGDETIAPEQPEVEGSMEAAAPEGDAEP